jgi:hypothetical protein
MKKIKILPAIRFILPILLLVSFFSCKKEVKLPKSVNIKSVTILRFPDSTGWPKKYKTWDIVGSSNYPTDPLPDKGSDPDVYFEIVNNFGNKYFSLPISLRKSNLKKSDLPFTWSSPTAFANINIDNFMGVRLKDLDDFDTPNGVKYELMEVGYGQKAPTFKSFLQDNNLPNEITWDEDEYTFKIGIEWVF